MSQEPAMDWVALPKIEVRTTSSGLFWKSRKQALKFLGYFFLVFSFPNRMRLLADQCLLLPFFQLHAHLSGSISRQCLHEVWLMKKEANETDLADPLVEMPDGKHDYNLKT